MASKKDKVFIVILNWNGWRDTVECLKSISGLKTGDFSLNVIVVDNSSTDNSVEEINKVIKKVDNVFLITNSSNLGFAEGNNVGMRYALSNNADFVCILNNDTTVDKNLVNEFLYVAKKNPEAGIISPKIFFSKGYEFHKDRYKESDLGKVIWSAGGSIDWDNMFGTNNFLDSVDSERTQEIKEIDFATGACMFLKSNYIEKIGLFDAKFFLYFEDVDLSIRMNKANKILYAPKAIVWHKVSQSSEIGGKLNDYFITRNRLLLGLRYAPWRTKLALARQSINFLLFGREWQKKGVIDFLTNNYYKGSWQ